MAKETKIYKWGREREINKERQNNGDIYIYIEEVQKRGGGGGEGVTLYICLY